MIKYIKPNIMSLLKKVLLTMMIVIGLTFSFDTMGQDEPPEPPSSHGETTNQEGGRAPIGGGLLILIGLGAAYGGRKLYQMRKENLEE